MLLSKTLRWRKGGLIDICVSLNWDIRIWFLFHCTRRLGPFFFLHGDDTRISSAII